MRTVLFDLDGTLLDTAPDLVQALNEVLRAHGRAPVDIASVRHMVSHGAGALVRVGLGIEAEDAAYAPAREALLRAYAGSLAVHTRPFPGMPAVLEQIAARGLSWGVVTNKPARYTEPLMAALGLAERAACIVSGDTVGHAKPHPEPMWLACTRAGSDPADCLYIGDARRDVEAGRAAGMPTLVAAFGYLAPGDRPETWGADGIVTSPDGILDWLEGRPALA